LLTTYNLIYPSKAHIYSSTALYSLIQFVALFFIIKRSRKLPNSLLPHIGFISLTFFASIHFGLKKELTTNLLIGQKITFSGQNLTLVDIQYNKGANYVAKTAIITTGENMILKPQIRNYPIERTQTAEIAILQHLLYDLYISIGSTDKKDMIAIDIKFNPAMNMIWLSCSIIALGALLTSLRSLLNR
jgi:cytochrome c biogenesis factor